ncbi:hypothetical protein [Hoeflea alexandrii]|uniref:hypothetical protein n=1 Tax=Hoeflea alexandrii TaxID=288436 RepID=UPI00361C8546
MTTGQRITIALAEADALELQPVIRSRSGPANPAGVKSVAFFAHDNPYGAGGRQLTVEPEEEPRRIHWA